MKVHHVEVLCRSLERQLETFCTRLGFHPFAVQTDSASQEITAVAVKLGTVKLVFRQDSLLKTDTARDIVIEVQDVKGRCDAVLKEGGSLLKRCQEVDMGKQKGSVTLAVVKSPLGNLQHTLLCTDKYEDFFLPGFEPVSAYLNRRHVAIGHSKSACGLQEALKKAYDAIRDPDEEISLDHIAFAVKTGSNVKYLNWYKKCFGFERFIVSEEEKDDGLLVRARAKEREIAMKLVATDMSYHLCSEVGCEFKSDDRKDTVKLVFGEPFPNQGPNQLTTFIDAHGGEGLQHIALRSENIIRDARAWNEQGIQFIMPPRQYYDEVNERLRNTGHFSREQLERQGILIDIERSNGEDTGYLLQAFTKPVFSKSTMFMEPIERHSTTGFGAGNISTLWVAFEKYFDEQGYRPT